MTQVSVEAIPDQSDATHFRAPPAWKLGDVALLVTALLIAAGVRFWYIDYDLSYDELWHQALSSGRGTPFGFFSQDVLHTAPARLTSLEAAPAWWHIWTGGMDGVLHPPLYVVTLRWWRDVFGDSDLASVAYSLAWSLAAIAFTFAAVRLVAGRWLAFTTTLAMGVSQTQSYLSQEVRAYAMLIGLAAISLWMMTRIEVFGVTRRRAVGVALMTLPLLLTHYFAFGAAVGIALYGLLRFRGFRTPFVITLIAAGLSYVAMWVPWAIQQLDDLGTGDAFLKRPFEIGDQIALFAAAPMRLVVDRSYLKQPQWLAGGVLFVLPFLLLKRQRWLLPWALWLLCSLGGLFVLNVIRSTTLLSLVRYAAIATPAVFVLGTACAWSVRRPLGHAVALSLAGMGAIFLISRNDVLNECPSYADVERALIKNVQDCDGVIFYHGVLYVFSNDVFALQASHAPGLFPRPMTIISGPMKPELVAQLPGRSWLVTGTLDEPLEKLVPGAKEIRRVNVDLNLVLIYLELPRSTPATAASPVTRPSAPGA